MKLIIKDDDGKVLQDVETNCVVAAAHKTGTGKVVSISKIKAGNSILAATLSRLDDDKEKLIREHIGCPVAFEHYKQAVHKNKGGQV